MNRLIVVSAPSGAGKTTLCARLLARFPEMVLSISSTTRAPRGHEENKKAYFFLTREEFEAQKAQGLFAEWALVHDHFYGTSKKTIESAFQKGKSVLLDIDVQGAQSLRVAYPEQSVLIFVAPPSLQELETRLRARGTDSEEVILKRLRNAEKEMKAIDRFDHVVVNDDLDRAYGEIERIVRTHVKA